MDPFPILYGAVAGFALGVLWGRFERTPGSRPQWTSWQGIAGLVLFVVTIEVFDWIRPQLPNAFWLTSIVVAWVVKPLGDRLRERSASGRETPGHASPETPSSRP